MPKNRHNENKLLQWFENKNYIIIRLVPKKVTLSICEGKSLMKLTFQNSKDSRDSP